MDTDEVIDFNDTLIELIDESDGRFEPFMVFLDQYLEGREVDIASMDRVCDDLEKSIAGDCTLLQQTEVPDNELCKKFYSSCLEYIENAARFTDKYREVIDYISAHNPGNDADVEAVDALLAKLWIKDEQLGNALDASQEVLAREFGFELQ